MRVHHALSLSLTTPSSPLRSSFHSLHHAATTYLHRPSSSHFLLSDCCATGLMAVAAAAVTSFFLIVFWTDGITSQPAEAKKRVCNQTTSINNNQTRRFVLAAQHSQSVQQRNKETKTLFLFFLALSLSFSSRFQRLGFEARCDVFRCCCPNPAQHGKHAQQRIIERKHAAAAAASATTITHHTMLCVRTCLFACLFVCLLACSYSFHSRPLPHTIC